MLTLLKFMATVLAAGVLTACGLNILTPEGFPVEDVQPNAPDGWLFAGATGGDDWAEYLYAIDRDSGRLTLVVCVSNGTDGLDHCNAIPGPARPLTDLNRFPTDALDIRGAIVCAGTDPCGEASIDGLSAEWNAG